MPQTTPSEATRDESAPTLLRGRGPALGRCSTAFPFEQRTMLHVLARQVRERPDATWLVFDGRDRLTFAKAQLAINRVANAVADSVPAGSHVGILLPNQVEFIEAIYGAMAARCVAVPFNAQYRGQMLEQILEYADVRVLITCPEFIERLTELGSLGLVETIVCCGEGPSETPAAVHGAQVVLWDDWLDGRSDEAPGELPHGADTAAIQFTSGTTGRSKGAVHPHHFIFLYSGELTAGQERTSEDVLSTPLPLFHIAALHGVVGSALHAGCTAHIKSRFSASSFWSQAAADGATWSLMIGTMAAVLSKTSDVVPAHSIRTVLCVPPPTDMAQFEQRFGVTVVWQGFGMSEIGPHVFTLDQEADVPLDTLGHPAAWCDYGVVDEHDWLLPPGETGQLVYRPLLPYAMASGYYGDPEATARAFRNFMFHTGDLASYDEEGRLHYRGRMQDRIRRRGENINAAELEAVACRHPAIFEAAAYAVPGEFGEDDVKLDLLMLQDADLGDVHAWLREQLPRFMIPRYLERHESFPKTPSQRIQKHVLLKSGLERPEVVDFEPSKR